MGVRPGFLGRVVEAGYHQCAVRLVQAGMVDAAAIDSQVLAVELRDHPDLASLRVVGSFGPSTIQPVVAASRLPGPLKDQVRDVPVSLGDDPTARTTLAHGFVQGFARVDDAAYDDLREMVATIESAGWTSLTWEATGRREHRGAAWTCRPPTRRRSWAASPRHGPRGPSPGPRSASASRAGPAPKVATPSWVPNATAPSSPRTRRSGHRGAGAASAQPPRRRSGSGRGWPALPSGRARGHTRAVPPGTACPALAADS
jgi:ABC transporter, phosphonate, periplasmic substrate-binding protein